MAARQKGPVTPFPFQVLLLTLGGTISLTQSWSCGVHIIHDNSDETPTAVNLATMLSAYEGPATTWANAVRELWSVNTVFEEMNLYSYVPTSGKAHASSTLHPASVAGGSGTVMPSQVSVCCTKNSNLSGASARGRWYMPGTGIALTPTYQMTQAVCTEIADATASFFTAVNSVNGIPAGLHNMACVIASRTTNTFHPIDEVTVDSRADVQRRRADKIRAQFLGQSPVGG